MKFTDWNCSKLDNTHTIKTIVQWQLIHFIYIKSTWRKIGKIDKNWKYYNGIL